MCLSKITASYDKPSGLIVDGWKEFDNGRVFGRLTYPNMGGTVEMDKWISASDLRPPVVIKASDGKPYMAGFHVYADEKEVKKYASRRVYVRNITCAGVDGGLKCLIAQEMYVPSKPDAWPPLAPDKSKKGLMDRMKSGGKS
jgi:hypothetical protein